MKKTKFKNIILVLTGILMLITASIPFFFKKEKNEVKIVEPNLEGIYYYENGQLHVDTNASGGQSSSDELLFFDTDRNSRSHGTIYVTPGTTVYFDAGAYGSRGYSYSASNNIISLSSTGGLFTNDISGKVSSSAVIGQTFSVSGTVKWGFTNEKTNTINFQVAWGETLKFNVNNSNSSNSYTDQKFFTADGTTKSITWTLPTTNPTATGYDFLGWYDGNTYAGKAGDTYTKVYSADNTTTTLVARWQEAKYTVSFDANGGTGTMNSQEFSGGVATALPENTFTREGYDFAGWSTNKDATTPQYTDKQQISSMPGDGKLYAIWSLKNYSINYELDGGTNSTSNPQTVTKEDTVVLQNATKTGYTFEGWYTDADFNNQITTIESGTLNEINLYAKFTVNQYKYKVRYYYQNIADDNYTEDTSLAEEKIADYGTLIDYYTDKAKTGFKINATNPAILTVTEKEENNNLNVYYNREKYQVTFTAPGASTVPVQRIKYNGTASKPADPTRPGYTFDKWYIDTDFDGVGDSEYDFATPVNTEIALVATWTLNNYTVTYNLQNGETNSQNNPTTVTINDNIILEQATKQGYDFAGWVDNNNNPVTKLEGTTQNLVLTPTWTPSENTPYKITYTFEGLNGEPNEVIVENYTATTGTEVDISDKLEKYNRDDFGFELDTNNSTIKDTIKADGTTNFEVSYKRKSFTINYDTNGGEPIAPETKKYEDKINKTATKEGYIFDGWMLNENDYDDNTKISKDMTLVAKWKPAKTTYSIEFYLEELDGTFTLAKTEEQEAYVEDNITVEPPKIDGYEADVNNEQNKASGTVEPRGELTVKLYYTRKEYTIKYDNDGDITEETVKYEDNVKRTDEPTKTGYTFGGWLLNGEVYDMDTMVTDDITLTPNWIPNKDTKYVVRYYKTNPDGTAELIREEVLQGTTDSEVEANIENIEGYKVNEQKSTLKTTISPDGTAVLEVFYDLANSNSVVTGDMIAMYTVIVILAISLLIATVIIRKRMINKK